MRLVSDCSTPHSFSRFEEWPMSFRKTFGVFGNTWRVVICILIHCLFGSSWYCCTSTWRWCESWNPAAWCWALHPSLYGPLEEAAVQCALGKSSTRTQLALHQYCPTHDTELNQQSTQFCPRRFFFNMGILKDCRQSAAPIPKRRSISLSTM